MAVIILDIHERYGNDCPKTAEITIPADLDINPFLLLGWIAESVEYADGEDGKFPVKVVVPWDFTKIISTACFRRLEMKFKFGIQYAPGVKEAIARYDYS